LSPKLDSRKSGTSNRKQHQPINDISVQFNGLYARVARKARVDASFVSRVARGQRTSDKVERVLVRELEFLHAELGKLLKKGSRR